MGEATVIRSANLGTYKGVILSQLRLIQILSFRVMFNLNEQEAVGRSRCCLFVYFFKPRSRINGSIYLWSFINSGNSKTLCELK